MVKIYRYKYKSLSWWVVAVLIFQLTQRECSGGAEVGWSWGDPGHCDGWPCSHHEVNSWLPEVIIIIHPQHWWLHKSGTRHHWIDVWWRRGWGSDQHVHPQVFYSFQSMWLIIALQLWQRPRIQEPDDRRWRKLHTDWSLKCHPRGERISRTAV